MSSKNPKSNQKPTIRSAINTNNGEAAATTPTPVKKRVSIIVDSTSSLLGSLKPVPEFEELVYANRNRRRSSTGSRKVWFRDEKSNEDNGQPQGEPEGTSSLDLVQVSYFDDQTKDKEPWDDSNYYAGFMDLYAADEIWLWDISCCACRIDRFIEIVNKAGKRIFYVETKAPTCMTLAKAICLRPFNRARCGFVIQLFSLNYVKLVKYVRKSFLFAKELDIVETFYGRNETYMGRIEKTTHGFLIRDSEDEDIYRVISTRGSKYDSDYGQPVKHNKKCVEMRIFRSDSHEVVGRLLYAKKGCLCTTLHSLCCSCSHAQFGIRCLPTIGTNAKILMIGTLLFQLYCKEDFLDLPLGKAAKEREPLTLPHSSLSRDLFFSPDNIEKLDLKFSSESDTSW